MYWQTDQKLDYFLSSITVVLDHYLQQYEMLSKNEMLSDIGGAGVASVLEI